MTQQEICTAIAAESERQVIKRLGEGPGTWLTGGSQHNDYRLSAEIDDDGSIMVSDTSGGLESYRDEADMGNVQDFVTDWLDITMN